MINGGDDPEKEAVNNEKNACAMTVLPLARRSFLSGTPGFIWRADFHRLVHGVAVLLGTPSCDFQLQRRFPAIIEQYWMIPRAFIIYQ